MKITAVCTDIDGTLLDSRRELSARTISAIQNVRQKMPVILASSRMPAAMRHLQVQLGIAGHPMICYNGGYILREGIGGATPAVLDSVQISLPTCESILSIGLQFPVHLSLYANNDWFTASYDKWAIKEESVTKVSPQLLSPDIVLSKWREAGNGAHKIMCMGSESEIAQMYERLVATLAGEIHIYRSKSTYLELAPRAVSKASALEIVMNQCYGEGLSGVMVFGDNYNDIEMVRMAGLGIAVDNAIPEVKGVARELTLNSRADGVAVALEKYAHLM